MEHLRCVVERITYQNAENGYSVLKVAVKKAQDLMTVVGTMPETHVGSVLSLEGYWKVDAKYGRQFCAEKFEETLPATVYGIEKYLGSGLIKGVGPKFAGRIVQKFGKDTLDIIEETPDRLLEVEGIGKIRVERIKKSWIDQKEIKNIMLFLQGYGVSTAHATKIYKTYASDSINVVKDNPYRLADDIWGIGFKTADTIAEKLGIGKDRFIRLRSGILYTLNKLADHMTLIMVGDTDQLPSVGAGNVLKDMIASGRIPVVRLTRIFRQAQGSRIIMNAHRINKGEAVDLRGGKDSDFFFASKDTNEEVVETLVQFCTKNLPRYYHADAFRDIQVLTPMQRGICGAANLNQVLQQAMNPSSFFLRRGGTEYRLKDKVMQIRNDYDKEVFNGDIGTIAAVDMEERELTVDYDGRAVVYDVTELDELTLAYATTIHKAQGSEYPIVVMPFTMSHYVMLQRNLLYTGVTRAKKTLVLIGEKKALWYAIKNETTAARNTRLAERLKNGTAPQQKKAAAEMPGERTVTYKGGTKITFVREEPATYGGGLFERLAQSKFRSSFTLKANDRAYIREKGVSVVQSHAADFVAQRLAPAEPKNDGKQTPMRGHPVFVAQHATATCCRSCLQKWHGIPQKTELSQTQQEYIVRVIMEWIRRQQKIQFSPMQA